MTCCDASIDCIPVLAILTIFCWSYYAYVVELCVNTLESQEKQVSYLIFFHIFFGLAVVSYFAVMCTEKDTVPEEYKIPPQYSEELKNCTKEVEGNAILERICQERQLNLRTVSSNGFVRYCSKCKHIKPDRAHHCSTCKTCVLKMDHHCPWVNNCVGYSNYKIFLTFLFHATVFCLYCFGTTFEYFVTFWVTTDGDEKKGRHFQILILFTVGGALGMLVFFFFAYHMSLVFRNETTLEALREERFKDPNSTFDLGCIDNFLEVFGESCWCWFCPVQTTMGNGVDFDVATKE